MQTSTASNASRWLWSEIAKEVVQQRRMQFYLCRDKEHTPLDALCIEH